MREWEVYQKPNFFPLRHSDDDVFFAMLSCCGNSVLQLFNFFFFGKGCVWYEELRKVKKVLSSDAARRGGWHPPISVNLCVYLHLSLKRVAVSDSLPRHTEVQFDSETENQ